MDFKSLNKRYSDDILRYINRLKNVLNIHGENNIDVHVDNFDNIHDVKITITSNLANYLRDNNLSDNFEQNVEIILKNVFGGLDLRDLFHVIDIKIIYENNKIIINSNILEFGKKDEMKIIKYIKQNMENDDVEYYEGIIKLYTDVAWKSSNTFNDLQALNLSFIQGYLSATPSHFGILDPESNIIGTELYNINKFDFLTTNSQPYDKFIGNFPGERGKEIIQTPFIEGIYHRNKINKFIQLLKQINNNIAISHLDTKTMKKSIYNPKNIEHNNLPDRYANYVTNQFGTHNIDLIKNNFDYIIIYSDENNNNVFTQITDILKQLL